MTVELSFFMPAGPRVVTLSRTFTATAVSKAIRIKRFKAALDRGRWRGKRKRSKAERRLARLQYHELTAANVPHEGPGAAFKLHDVDVEPFHRVSAQWMPADGRRGAAFRWHVGKPVQIPDAELVEMGTPTALAELKRRRGGSQ